MDIIVAIVIFFSYRINILIFQYRPALIARQNQLQHCNHQGEHLIIQILPDSGTDISGHHEIPGLL